MNINVVARLRVAFGVDYSPSKKSKEYNFLEAQKRPSNSSKFNLEKYQGIDIETDKVVFSYDDIELVFNDMLQGDTSKIYAPPLLISFSQEKNLIETVVKGSDNIIVERWGTAPWDIDIRGILIDTENRIYPTDEIESLVKLFQHNDIIEVVGVQFYDKNIDSIYTKNLTISPVEGFSDTIQFSISARSQKAVNYTLLNPIE